MKKIRSLRFVPNAPEIESDPRQSAALSFRLPVTMATERRKTKAGTEIKTIIIYTLFYIYTHTQAHTFIAKSPAGEYLCDL